MAKRVFLDLNRCIGCHSCSAACYYAHGGNGAVSFAPLSRGEGIPSICRHCEEPPCVAACPRNALQKRDDGSIVRMKMLCIGCRSCAYACPFGVIDADLLSHVVSKCDLCVSRTSEGKEPACVTGCPSGALYFNEVPDIAREYTFVGGRVGRRYPVARAGGGGR